MGKYLAFDEVSRTDKTETYSVKSKVSAAYLGRVKWYAPWRRYAFCPEAGTTFDAACLTDIMEFISGLMQTRATARKLAEK